MTNKCSDQLLARNLIDDAMFIDGTKLLADAISTALSGRKQDPVRSNESRKTAYSVPELREAYALKQIPEGTTMTVDMVVEVLTRMELRLDGLEKEFEATKLLFLVHPAKQQRRTLKSQLRKLSEKREKFMDHKT